MDFKRAFKEITFTEITLYISLLLTGIFHEYLSCAVSVALICYLIYKLSKSGRIVFYRNSASISVVVMVAFYGISCMYAVDSGMAFLGFLKFLPVMLYLLSLMQVEHSNDRIINRLPYVAFALCIVSFVFMFVPGLKNYFVVADRMAGFFQYPNTFALFLLVGELIALSKKKTSISDAVVICGLLFGIICTGSRTVFVLTVLSNIAVVFLEKSKKTKLIASVIAAAVVIAVAALYPVLSRSETLGRFFTISVFESTFVGRLLYFRDALPVILRHPFGCGYMGYNYIQHSVQTGVYSVRYVHNDFLQIMLDVGWVPCALIVSAIIRTILSRRTDNCKKIVLSVVFLHSCFDFNLQFVAMFFILVILMDYESSKEYKLKSGGFLNTALVLLATVSLYCSIPASLTHFGAYRASAVLYPWNTENKIALLLLEEDLKEADKLADNILAQNEYVTVAYSVKSRYAYSQGDFEKLIHYKNETFRIAPLVYEEYEEYCYMLINGIELYKQAGDSSSARICKREFLNTYRSMQNLPDKLSSFGSMIDQQPQTLIPEDLVYYFSVLEGEY